MIVAVGTTSQYKINAASDAVQLIFSGDAEVSGVEVRSRVSDQPMSNVESILGARNRARMALELSGADYAIGIENGLTQVEGIWFANTWIVAIDTEMREGLASTILRPVPHSVMAGVRAGLELSDAVCAAFPVDVRDRYSGLIGIVTRGSLNRHDVLRDGIVVAMSSLVRFDVG